MISLKTDLYCLELLGYEEDQVTEISADHTTTPASSAKRLRQSCSGDDSDWIFLVKSQEYQSVSHYLNDILHLNVTNITNDNSKEKRNDIKINHNSIFFTNVKVIHFTLHLLYEELKLNVLRKNDLKLLASFLSKIAYDLDFEFYQVYYWKDFPDVCNASNYTNRHKVNPINLKSIISWPCADNKPIGIFQFLYDLLDKNGGNYAYPFIRNVNPRCRDIIQVSRFNYRIKTIIKMSLLVVVHLFEVSERC